MALKHRPLQAFAATVSIKSVHPPPLPPREVINCARQESLAQQPRACKHSLG